MLTSRFALRFWGGKDRIVGADACPQILKLRMICEILTYQVQALLWSSRRSDHSMGKIHGDFAVFPSISRDRTGNPVLY